MHETMSRPYREKVTTGRYTDKHPGLTQLPHDAVPSARALPARESTGSTDDNTSFRHLVLRNGFTSDGLLARYAREAQVCSVCQCGFVTDQLYMHDSQGTVSCGFALTRCGFHLVCSATRLGTGTTLSDHLHYAHVVIP